MYRIAAISFHGCPVARLGERDTGGMNVYVLQMAKELGRRGHRVDVYTRCHDPADPQVVELGENARVIHLEAGPYGEPKENLHDHIPQFVANLYRFQESEGLSYDLIHSHYWLSGEIGAILGQRLGASHVVSFHTLAEIKRRARAGEQEPALRISGERQVMAAATAIVAQSRHEREEVVRLYGTPPHKIHVIPAGVDLDLFQPADRKQARRGLGLKGKRAILYVGRIEPLKGLHILLDAVAQIEDKADVRLLIVGGNPATDPEVARLKSVTERLGIQAQVSFIGTVKQAELPAYYSAADVCVLPSYYESFGLVALEAMACGTPVVASRVGGLQTLVKDGETGYLIPWRCPEPFAQRLEMLLRNKALRRTMGKAARCKAQEMSWSVVADRTLELYGSLLGASWASAAGG